MSSVPSIGASFNWLQSASSASSSGIADWMSPSSRPTAMELAASAFAEAQQIKVSNLNSIAVRQGIATQHKKLAGVIDFSA